jgi:ABC-type nitrate/sulfonate/bicarbonate transport system substrate-binding protein
VTSRRIDGAETSGAGWAQRTDQKAKRPGGMLMNAVRMALCCALLLAATGARAADKVVAGSLGGQAPLWAIYVAVHKGFFKAEGLDLELNFARSGAAVTQQLTGGSLDVALSVGITDPIHAIEKGAPLALIRVVGNSPPYVLIGKSELKSIKDLKGKTVSSGAPNDITNAYLTRMMEANGFKKGDYEITSAGVSAARYAALKAGVADAAVVLPPLNFVGEHAGYVTLGVAADYVKDIPFTGMAVNKNWAKGHADLVKRVLAATDKSVAWLLDTSHRAEAIELLVTAAHSTKENAEKSYDFMRRIKYFETGSKVSKKKLQNLIETERSAGNVGAALTPEMLAMPGVTELTD